MSFIVLTPFFDFDTQEHVGVPLLSRTVLVESEVDPNMGWDFRFSFAVITK
jgi:hypothetical protein